MRSRQVLFLITGLELGGAEKQLSMLALALKRRAWEPTVISLTGYGQFGAILRNGGIMVKSLDMHCSLWGKFKGLLALQQHLWRHRPDVLCGFLFHANLLARIFGAINRIGTIVCSVRNERETPRVARAAAVAGSGRASMSIVVRMAAMRMTQRLCDMTVVNSRAVGTALESRGVLDARWRVIPNAVDARVPAALDSAIGSDGGMPGFNWLAIGGLVPLKGYTTLLEAWADVIEEFPTAHLRIAGDGPQRDEIEKTIELKELARSVTLLGFRSDVPALLGQANAVVHPSWTEASPNAVLEALAQGKPVVACHVGGIPELVTENATGYLVAPRDPAELADAMRLMMRLSVEQRIQMGRTAQADVARRFNLDVVASAWEMLFSELLTTKA